MSGENLSSFVEMTAGAIIAIITGITGIVIAIIKKPKNSSNSSDLHSSCKTGKTSDVAKLQDEITQLNDEIERQHIQIDDMRERLAWLEGRSDKK